MASYPSHHLALYTINGKLLRCEMHSDSINVSNLESENLTFLANFIFYLVCILHFFQIKAKVKPDK